MEERHRREGLGRNRPVSVRSSLSLYYVGFFAVLVAAWFAWRYFTEPHRVFAAREFDCPAWDVTWAERGGVTEITGCNRLAYVECSEERCIQREAP